MLDSNPDRIISEMAKTNSELARTIKDDKVGKEFWYWLGYWNGQDSILNPDDKIANKQIVNKYRKQ